MSRAELVREPSQTHAAPVEIDPVVEKHRGARGSLIAILQDVQARYGYLPEEALKTVSRLTGQPLAEIYGVASFYRAFSLTPRGKHVICICAGTACHVRGAPIVTAEFERQLKVGVGETTPDREFTLETVNCLGACALGPIVVADGKYEANVGTAAVRKIIRKAARGDLDVSIEGDDRIFPVDVSCPRCNHRLMDPSHLIDGYPSIRVTIFAGRRHGWLRLSSLYGSYHVQSEFEIEHDAVPDFFCPHCHAELRGASDCVDCGAPMVPMFVRGGGVVQICARRGCKGHMLDLNGVSS
jgi:NADH-quinone oxidoreductase subunit E